MKRPRGVPGSRGGWLVAGLALAVAIVAVVLNAVNPGGPVPRSRPVPPRARVPSHARVPAHVRVPSHASAMGVVEFDSTAADARDPVLAAAELHFYWSQIEPRPGVFEWQRVDGAMRPWVAAGKQVVLRISAAGDESWSYRAGHATPGWVYAAGVPHVTTSNGSVLPVYWDPPFERAWGGFIATMARHYDGDPHIAYVEAGIGEGGETLAETETSDPERAQRWLAPDVKPVPWSVGTWAGYVETIAGDYVRDWHRTPVAVMVDSTFFGGDHAALVSLERWLIDHGVRQFQTNGLTPDLVLMSPWRKVTVSAEERNCSCTSGASLGATLARARAVHARWVLVYAGDVDQRDFSRVLAKVQP